ncbi:acetylserotonin O-methyltransferase-like [Hibiscus syriacus]|uniref:acetylserotonin O-methyltransferase-like n=1 Tax=Hibiscus syriacus TaxID=106335 RepID=UPI001921EF33|nr:acetylserotonin O-methyltransferase-like [Hibiscus syriacus]
MGDMEARAEVDIWSYVFGYTKTAAVKCAIELGVADVIENHGSPMPLSQLAAALRYVPSRLQRIMRFLVHYQVFKEEPIGQHSMGFSLTPLSRRLIKHGEKTIVPFILLMSSPIMLGPWHSLSARVLQRGNISPFEAANGMDFWSYTEANPGHSKLFNDAMACKARLTISAIIKGCPEVFDGVQSLVDAGGGNGTAMSLLVKQFPRIRGINFDLPHVVVVAPKFGGIENVGGDMFMSIPNADAVFLMWILHDWDDEECIKILKKCREAIPEDKGKVIIVEAVLEEENKGDELEYVRLMLDMVMMTHTNKGKERSLKEWSYVLQESGFTRFNVKSIQGFESVIEVYP